MLPASARSCSIFRPAYGSSPRVAAPSSGGMPMPMSASPFSTRAGFCAAPPFRTFTAMPLFSWISSAMPREIVSQPPPATPPVQMIDDWAAPGLGARATTIAASTTSHRRSTWSSIPCAPRYHRAPGAPTMRKYRDAEARTLGRAIALASTLSLGVWLGGCAISPVGVSKIDSAEVHQRLTQSALSSDKVSTFTENVLFEADLVTLFDKDPEKALDELHDLAVSGSGGPNELFAAAEASFLHAERSNSTPYYMATAVYAWAYLFPEDPSEAPSPFDPRFRLAANLYNRGLTASLKAGDGQLTPHGGAIELPFGQLTVSFDKNQTLWQGRRMTDFVPMAEFRVLGLRTYYRTPGIGAPLAASVAPRSDRSTTNDLLQSKLVVPVTALLRLPRSRTALSWPPFAGPLSH